MIEVLTVLLLSVVNIDATGYWVRLAVPLLCYSIGYCLGRKNMLEKLRELKCYRNAYIGIVSEDTIKGMDLIISKFEALIDEDIDKMETEYRDDGN